MSDYPEDVRYIATHQWVKLDDQGFARVGITDVAQAALGDVVFVELPDIDRLLKADEVAAVVESLKAVSDVFSPVSGKVRATNEQLDGDPELVNESPYDKGWFFELENVRPEDLEQLLTAAAYRTLCESQ